MIKRKGIARTICAGALTTALVACGGGGGGGGGSDPQSNPNTDVASEQPTNGATGSSDDEATGGVTEEIDDGAEDTTATGGAPGPVITDPDNAENLPPRVTSLVGPSDPLQVGETTSFSWTASDIDSTMLTCQFDADNDGEFDVTIPNCSGDSTIEFQYGVPGQFSATLLVTDTSGATDEEQVIVNVLPLMVSLTAIDRVVRNQRLLLSYRVSNVSEVPVDNVNVALRVPEGMSFRSDSDASPNGSGCFLCNPGDEVRWSDSELQPGESRVFELNAFISDDLDVGTAINIEFTTTADNMLAPITSEHIADIVQSINTAMALEFSETVVPPGATFDVTAIAGNLDNQNFEDSSLRLHIPFGATLIAASDGGTLENDTVVWNLADFPVLQAQSRTATFSVDPTVVPGVIQEFSADITHQGGQGTDLETGLSVPVFNELPSVTARISSVQNPTQQGGRSQLVIHISNTSLLPVGPMQLTLRVPNGVSFRSDNDAIPSLSGCFLCNPGNEVSLNVEELAGGESRALQINTSLFSPIPAGSVLTFPFMIFVEEQLVDQVQRLNVRVDNTPRVQVIVSSSPHEFTEEDELSIDIDVANISANTLSDTDVTLRIPDSATVASSTPEGAIFDSNANTLEWSDISINVASSQLFSAALTPSPGVLPGELFEVTAQANLNGTTHIDATSSTNAAVIEQTPPLSLVIDTASPTTTPGGTVLYQLTVANEGLIPINNVSLQFRVPDGIVFRSDSDATPNGSGCFLCQGGNVVSWTYAALQPGEQQQIELNATVRDALPRGPVIAAPFTLTAPSLPHAIYRLETTPIR